MEQRSFNRLGRTVGVVGLGAWQLGADWGDGQRGRRAGRARRGRRRRRHLHRHRRRLRRRPQRAADRPVPRGAARRRAHRRHQDGPPGRRRCRRTTPWTTSAPGPTGPGPTSASTRSTWCSCTARRPPVYSDDAVFDALDTLVAEKAHRRVRRQRRDLRRGAHRDRPARRRQRADHPQRLPAQAAGAGAARRRRGRGRHHRPGAAGQRPAVRPVRRAHRRSPPTTTAPTTGTARRSTSARPSPASTTSTGLAAVRRLAPAGRRRARRWRSSRCAGSSTSRASPWSSPAPATPSRPGRNAAAADLPPLHRRPHWRPYGEVYDELIRPQVHDRW